MARSSFNISSACFAVIPCAIAGLALSAAATTASTTLTTIERITPPCRPAGLSVVVAAVIIAFGTRRHHRRDRSSRTISECSRTRCRTTSRPSGETSKFPHVEVRTRLVDAVGRRHSRGRSARGSCAASPLAARPAPLVRAGSEEAWHRESARHSAAGMTPLRGGRPGAGTWCRYRPGRRRIARPVTTRGRPSSRAATEPPSGRRPPPRRAEGPPASLAAHVIDRPSGAHAGEPRTSSDSATTRACVPSPFMTRSCIFPLSSVENATRPSGAMAGSMTPRPARSATGWIFRLRASESRRLPNRRDVEQVARTEPRGEGAAVSGNAAGG